jgi:hypothetical protein
MTCVAAAVHSCRADNGKRFFYILEGTYAEYNITSPRKFTMPYKLPADVACEGGCVLQW